ncbi:hypothetical protein [Methylobacterium durans]|uniref:hypothetical protein n=1 Tax=Methylobacterium durans TaxID=2202825 RepID=UPI0013A593A5|nr:hypothetical protein [Methylobacterium durans]
MASSIVAGTSTAGGEPHAAAVASDTQGQISANTSSRVVEPTTHNATETTGTTGSSNGVQIQGETLTAAPEILKDKIGPAAVDAQPTTATDSKGEDHVTINTHGDSTSKRSASSGPIEISNLHQISADNLDAFTFPPQQISADKGAASPGSTQSGNLGSFLATYLADGSSHLVEEQTNPVHGADAHLQKQSTITGGDLHSGDMPDPMATYLLTSSADHGHVSHPA